MSQINANGKRLRSGAAEADAGVHVGVIIDLTSEHEHLRAQLMGPISRDFAELQRFGSNLSSLRSLIQNFLGGFLRVKWCSHGPLQLADPSSETLANMLTSELLDNKDDAIQKIAQFSTNAAPYLIASTLQQDYDATTLWALRIKKALENWRWDADQITKGLPEASPAELLQIKKHFLSRCAEQRLFLRECREDIFEKMKAPSKDFAKVKTRLAACKDDEHKLLEMIATFDWSGKVSRAHIDSALTSLILLNVAKPIADYEYQRNLLLRATGKVKSATKSKIVYLGDIPMLRSLNKDIMAIGCIARHKTGPPPVAKNPVVNPPPAPAEQIKQEDDQAEPDASHAEPGYKLQRKSDKSRRTVRDE